MKTIDYSFIDKSGWQRGPWDNEPDKRQWMDEATGLPCLIVRGVMGSLCGYVGVPTTQRGAIDVDELEVHGGVTFTGPWRGTMHGICHVVGHGENDDVQWVGFDCAHYMDAMPGADAALPASFLVDHPMYGEGNTYRDFAYVTAECQRLAKQLVAWVGALGQRAP